MFGIGIGPFAPPSSHPPQRPHERSYLEYEYPLIKQEYEEPKFSIYDQPMTASECMYNSMPLYNQMQATTLDDEMQAWEDAVLGSTGGSSLGPGEMQQFQGPLTVDPGAPTHQCDPLPHEAPSMNPLPPSYPSHPPQAQPSPSSWQQGPPTSSGPLAVHFIINFAPHSQHSSSSLPLSELNPAFPTHLQGPATATFLPLPHPGATGQQQPEMETYFPQERPALSFQFVPEGDSWPQFGSTQPYDAEADAALISSITGIPSGSDQNYASGSGSAVAYGASSSPSTSISGTSGSPQQQSGGSSTSPPSGSGSGSGQSTSPTAPSGQYNGVSGSEQPDDISGNPRINIACSTCRSRKTKCDGVRPRCANCTRRGDECQYELAPKRRGPDRQPGTRVRRVFSKKLAAERGLTLPPMVKKKRGREEERESSEQGRSIRGLGRDQMSKGKRKMEERDWRRIKTEVDSPERFPLSPLSDSRPIRHVSPPEVTKWSPQAAYITELSSDDGRSQRAEETDGESSIVRQPSVDFARKTWWDSLLDMYAHSRESSYKQIQTDIAYVFSFSPYFISFINVPLFWATFHSPRRRDALQPSLIISFLALATFMRSSDIGAGAEGRQRALQIAEIARAYYQSSIDAGWLDSGLAQAAFMLTLFEMCPHPNYSAQRLASSFWALDGMLATLGWPSMDAYDDEAAVFAPGFVPSLSQHAHGHTPRPKIKDNTKPEEPQCSCIRFSLIASSASAQRVTPLWAETPGWDPDWREADVRKEEARRLVWNSLNLMSGHTSTTLAAGEGAADYWCTRAENYALLFPGETLLRSERWRGKVPHNHPRESIWGVYGRLALLYGACWRYFSPEASIQSSEKNTRYPFSASAAQDALAPKTEGDKAEFAYRAYVETLELEDLLDRHACAGERSTLFQGREFLFKIRVIISKDYTKHFPFPETGIDLSFHKRKAEQWLHHQMNLAQRLMGGLQQVTGMGANDLRLRPFLLWYFALQSQRCLQFHTIDPSLTVALDVADAWMVPVDWLVQIWPCKNMEPFFDELRQRILQARLNAGMAPFLPRVPQPIGFVSNPMLTDPSAVVA